jgi:hypothetical protein
LLGANTVLGGDQAVQTLKFSDPSKPGTVKLTLGRADLQIQGANTSEVTVKSSASAITSKPRKDGMRVLSAASSFSFGESDNVITLDAGKEWGSRGNSEFHLTVPINTTIIVPNSWGGDIKCSNISGDIEINSMHGEIRLDDVAGGVVVGTMNGEIKAKIRELHEGKPLSFASMNGEVTLQVPANVKANVRLRTQNGSVLTDFEESALITKVEATAGSSRSKTTTFRYSRDNRALSTEIQDAIREATQLSATAVREALEAVKEGLDAARLNTDDARRQMEDAKREMDRARRERDREKKLEARSASPRVPENADGAPPAPPAKPAAPGWPAVPKPAMPTITGGKLVTGTLNGGGPEISVSTMNGDVILRKLEAK